MKLQELKLSYTALERLPVDQNEERDVRANVPGAVYSLVDLQPLQEPRLVAVSSALQLLDVDDVEGDEPAIAAILSGSQALPECRPYAHCYCGYQFGFFAGQLGDGAATSLGEVVNSKGERWEVQLKGAGLTPYSRAGDGRKVLRSSIREFLCSEAMHALGIPTTRAAACVTSDTLVVRDPAYTGAPIKERATVVCRLAPSFLRFGSFEIFKTREESNTDAQGPSYTRPELLPRLVNYTISHHFPDIWALYGGGEDKVTPPTAPKAMYLAFFQAVVHRTAVMMARWQSVGFCHGVCNTDNMSILGLTLDYGPFGFMDRYHPDYVPNTSDNQGRYSYAEQPTQVKWNLSMLAQVLKLLQIPGQELTLECDQFWSIFDGCYRGLFRSKLGLSKRDEKDADDKLIADLLDVMASSGADFTLTFRSLSMIAMPEGDETRASQEADRADAAGPSNGAQVDFTSYSAADESDDYSSKFPQGAEQFLELILTSTCSPAELASSVQSTFHPQQIKILQQIAARDPSLLFAMGITRQDVQAEIEKLDKADEIRNQSEEAKAATDRRRWCAWVCTYQARLLREKRAGWTEADRVTLMNKHNPRVVLRNWVAQVAIEHAERGDYSVVQRVLALLEMPFRDWTEEELQLPLPGHDNGMEVDTEAGQSTSGSTHAAHKPPPPRYRNLTVSCSS